jgi:tRNA G18 (ribose-2'-O)-methylase SpoU
MTEAAATPTPGLTHQGYCGVGVYHPKHAVNIGTLWRSAHLFGAAFLCTIGRRYRPQASEPLQTPLYHYADLEDCYRHLPHDCQLVCVEQGGQPLGGFTHPARCLYLLGAEDYGLPTSILGRQHWVTIPTPRPESMNVAVAGSIVLYDRSSKRKDPGC